MSKKRYFKLGAKAHTFVDPKSGAHIVGPEVVAIDSKKARSSKQLLSAIEGGHIKEVTEEDFNKYQGSLAVSAKTITSAPTPQSTSQSEDEEEETEDEEKPKRGRGRGRK